MFVDRRNIAGLHINHARDQFKFLLIFEKRNSQIATCKKILAFGKLPLIIRVTYRSGSAELFPERTKASIVLNGHSSIKFFNNFYISQSTQIIMSGRRRL